MSAVIDEAVKQLNAKTDGSYDGSVKFVIEDEGTILLDEQGAREGDGPADTTLTADADTFKSILDGDTNPTSAFMTGKLKVDGDMGQAMKLASVL